MNEIIKEINIILKKSSAKLRSKKFFFKDNFLFGHLSYNNNQYRFNIIARRFAIFSINPITTIKTDLLFEAENGIIPEAAPILFASNFLQTQQIALNILSSLRNLNKIKI